MDANKLLFVKAGQGKKSTLDRAYNQHITNMLINLNEEEEERWETYDLIMNSLNGSKNNYINELKYRVTDGEDLNEVILSMINRNVLEVDGLAWLLKRRIEDYIEDDFLKRFYL